MKNLVKARNTGHYAKGNRTQYHLGTQTTLEPALDIYKNMNCKKKYLLSKVTQGIQNSK